MATPAAYTAATALLSTNNNSKSDDPKPSTQHPNGTSRPTKTLPTGVAVVAILEVETTTAGEEATTTTVAGAVATTTDHYNTIRHLGDRSDLGDGCLSCVVYQLAPIQPLATLGTLQVNPIIHCLFTGEDVTLLIFFYTWMILFLPHHRISYVSPSCHG